MTVNQDNNILYYVLIVLRYINMRRTVINLEYTI